MSVFVPPHFDKANACKFKSCLANILLSVVASNPLTTSFQLRWHQMRGKKRSNLLKPYEISWTRIRPSMAFKRAKPFTSATGRQLAVDVRTPKGRSPKGLPLSCNVPASMTFSSRCLLDRGASAWTMPLRSSAERVCLNKRQETFRTILRCLPCLRAALSSGLYLQWPASFVLSVSN